MKRKEPYWICFWCTHLNGSQHEVCGHCGEKPRPKREEEERNENHDRETHDNQVS